MPKPSLASPVEQQDEKPREGETLREAFGVAWVPDSWMMIGDAFLDGPGPSYEVCLEQSRAFTQLLYGFSQKLDMRMPHRLRLAGLPEEEQEERQREYLEHLGQALTLVDDKGVEDVLELLGQLEEIGGALRGALSDTMVTELQNIGFLRDEGEHQEPAFTFKIPDRAPVLWEMMYEEQEVDVTRAPFRWWSECKKPEIAVEKEWARFWGFRVPITYWTKLNRTAKIELRRYSFSATADGLEFADSEVEQISRLHKLKHKSLTEAFQQRVKEELKDRREGDESQVQAWFDACRMQKRAWLPRFLQEELTSQKARIPRETKKWKEGALKSIFANPHVRYDLMHFACHCEASDATPFLDELQMTVAKEPITLTAAFIKQHLRRQGESGDKDSPGPLVFLNACGTAEASSPSCAPPGLPESWIDSQKALAVIGTLCPVPDYFTHAFARKFYEFLFDPTSPRNHYLAEALLSTRRHFLMEHNNPLGLAYVLYAVPGARVELATEPAKPDQ